MSNPFLGEIRMFGGNFAPRQWAFCDGQIMGIAQNDALFSLLGSTFGGDGRTTFALPDLRGRLAVGVGQGNGLSNYNIGQRAGSEEVTLTTATIPSHSHSLMATTNDAVAASPTGQLTAKAPEAGAQMYTAAGSAQPTFGTLAPTACGEAGGSQSHENLMPSQCVTFIISLAGIYPSRN